MSFSITCNKCGSELVVEDRGTYLSNETVDLLANEDIEKGTTLELFCINSECNNYAKIII